MRVVRDWVIIALLFILGLGLVISEDCNAAEDDLLHLSYLPKSWHHGATSVTNEDHRGIMLSYNGWGIMHYTNSYGIEGLLLSKSYEVKEWKGRYGEFAIGGFVAYSDTYREVGRSPFLGGLTLRFDDVIILTVPTEVTAIKITLLRL